MVDRQYGELPSSRIISALMKALRVKRNRMASEGSFESTFHGVGRPFNLFQYLSLPFLLHPVYTEM